MDPIQMQDIQEVPYWAAQPRLTVLVCLIAVVGMIHHFNPDVASHYVGRLAQRFEDISMHLRRRWVVAQVAGETVYVVQEEELETQEVEEQSIYESVVAQVEIGSRSTAVYADPDISATLSSLSPQAGTAASEDPASTSVPIAESLLHAYEHSMSSEAVSNTPLPQIRTPATGLFSQETAISANVFNSRVWSEYEPATVIILVMFVVLCLWNKWNQRRFTEEIQRSEKQSREMLLEILLSQFAEIRSDNEKKLNEIHEDLRHGLEEHNASQKRIWIGQNSWNASFGLMLGQINLLLSTVNDQPREAPMRSVSDPQSVFTPNAANTDTEPSNSAVVPSIPVTRESAVHTEAKPPCPEFDRDLSTNGAPVNRKEASVVSSATTLTISTAEKEVADERRFAESQTPAAKDFSRLPASIEGPSHPLTLDDASTREASETSVVELEEIHPGSDDTRVEAAGADVELPFPQSPISISSPSVSAIPIRSATSPAPHVLDEFLQEVGPLAVLLDGAEAPKDSDLERLCSVKTPPLISLPLNPTSPPERVEAVEEPSGTDVNDVSAGLYSISMVSSKAALNASLASTPLESICSPSYSTLPTRSLPPVLINEPANEPVAAVRMCSNTEGSIQTGLQHVYSVDTPACGTSVILTVPIAESVMTEAKSPKTEVDIESTSLPSVGTENPGSSNSDSSAKRSVSSYHKPGRSGLLTAASIPLDASAHPLVQTSTSTRASPSATGASRGFVTSQPSDSRVAQRSKAGQHRTSPREAVLEDGGRENKVVPKNRSRLLPMSPTSPVEHSASSRGTSVPSAPPPPSSLRSDALRSRSKKAHSGSLEGNSAPPKVTDKPKNGREHMTSVSSCLPPATSPSDSDVEGPKCSTSQGVTRSATPAGSTTYRSMWASSPATPAPAAPAADAGSSTSVNPPSVVEKLAGTSHFVPVIGSSTSQSMWAPSPQAALSMSTWQAPTSVSFHLGQPRAEEKMDEGHLTSATTSTEDASVFVLSHAPGPKVPSVPRGKVPQEIPKTDAFKSPLTSDVLWSPLPTPLPTLSPTGVDEGYKPDGNDLVTAPNSDSPMDSTIETRAAPLSQSSITAPLVETSPASVCRMGHMAIDRDQASVTLPAECDNASSTPTALSPRISIELLASQFDQLAAPSSGETSLSPEQGLPPGASIVATSIRTSTPGNELNIEDERSIIVDTETTAGLTPSPSTALDTSVLTTNCYPSSWLGNATGGLIWKSEPSRLAPSLVPAPLSEDPRNVGFPQPIFRVPFYSSAPIALHQVHSEPWPDTLSADDKKLLDEMLSSLGPPATLSGPFPEVSIGEPSYTEARDQDQPMSFDGTGNMEGNGYRWPLSEGEDFDMDYGGLTPQSFNPYGIDQTPPQQQAVSFHPFYPHMAFTPQGVHIGTVVGGHTQLFEETATLASQGPSYSTLPLPPAVRESIAVLNQLMSQHPELLPPLPDSLQTTYPVPRPFSMIQESAAPDPTSTLTGAPRTRIHDLATQDGLDLGDDYDF